MSGAFALYPLANKWAEEFQKIHPDVRFNISAGGAGKGMADALARAVDQARPPPPPPRGATSQWRAGGLLAVLVIDYWHLDNLEERTRIEPWPADWG